MPPWDVLTALMQKSKRRSNIGQLLKMPRRSILSAAERDSLLALPDTKDDLIRHYTFSDTDLSIIRQRRGPANRLGFAVQLCYLRFPGVILGVDELPFPPLLKLVADQLKVNVESWDDTDSGSRPGESTWSSCKRCSATSRSRRATTGRPSSC